MNKVFYLLLACLKAGSDKVHVVTVQLFNLSAGSNCLPRKDFLDKSERQKRAAVFDHSPLIEAGKTQEHSVTH